MDKLEKELNALRESIDKIDDEIIRMFKVRMEHNVEIGKVKKDMEVKKRSKKREAFVLKTRINRGKRNYLRETFIKRIFKLVITEARRIEKRRKLD